jgi:hypothetical protein
MEFYKIKKILYQKFKNEDIVNLILYNSSISIEICKSWQNRSVKGCGLNIFGLQWVVVTDENMMHNNCQYVIGKNEDLREECRVIIGENNKLHGASSESFLIGGYYFYPLDIIGLYMEFGNGYHYVSFADDEDVWLEYNKCKAKKIMLSVKIG